MADRYFGSVYLGGRVTREQFNECVELLECCTWEGTDEDGLTLFQECRADDFDPIVEYCENNQIPLSIHWEGLSGEDSQVSYFVGGTRKHYTANARGDVVVDLQDLLKHPSMSVEDYVASLEIPEFPDFEIIDECVFCGLQCTPESGCDAYISNGGSAKGNHPAIEANIRKTISRMQSQGTVGASIACLRLNTPTTGVNIPTEEYEEAFKELAENIAKECRFDLLNDGTWASIMLD